MKAKTEARERARALRSQGGTYDEIAAELGVSKSSVSLWVRDLPKPPARTTQQEHVRRMAEARWAPHRERMTLVRRQTRAAAERQIGSLSERELFLTGVALYWAEGTKSKGYARREAVQFINSDPDVIALFLRWLELLGVGRERWRFTVSIHESADVLAAERYWAELAAVPVESLRKTVIKKHNPKTVRKNTGETYRGCLAVYVTGGADLYRRIEGWWCGIVGAAAADGAQR